MNPNLIPRELKHIPPPLPNGAGAWGPCSFILPTALLDALAKHLKKRPIDPEIINADRALAKQAVREPHLVGFWKEAPIKHDLLAEGDAISDFLISDAAIQEYGWDKGGLNAAKVRANFEEVDGPTAWLRRGRRAYCGWLSCNAQFVAEHDTVWESSRPELEQFGIPQMGPAVPPPVIGSSDAQLAIEPLRGLFARFEAFLRRWDLAQLNGPRLPYPFGDQFPLLGGGLQPGHGTEAIASAQVARTTPTLPGEMLRTLIDTMQGRNQVGPHLTPWMKIVAKGNAARQTLVRYGRLFALQHYWRVVKERYRPACHRSRGLLELAFAQFLKVDLETIHADLQFIRKRLGPDWDVASTAPVESGTPH